MEIIPNANTLWFMLPFVVTVIGLQLLLFKPFYAYLEAREAHTVGASAEAAQLLDATERKLTEIADKLSAAKAQAAATRAAAREQALSREAARLADTRDDVNEQIREGMRSIQAEAATARDQLRGDAQHIAQDVVQSLLGREVRS